MKRYVVECDECKFQRVFAGETDGYHEAQKCAVMHAGRKNHKLSFYSASLRALVTPAFDGHAYVVEVTPCAL